MMLRVKSYLCSCASLTVTNIKSGRKTAIQAECSFLVGMHEKLIQTEQLPVPLNKQTRHKQQAQRTWNWIVLSFCSFRHCSHVLLAEKCNTSMSDRSVL